MPSRQAQPGPRIARSSVRSETAAAPEPGRQAPTGASKCPFQRSIGNRRRSRAQPPGARLGHGPQRSRHRGNAAKRRPPLVAATYRSQKQAPIGTAASARSERRPRQSPKTRRPQKTLKPEASAVPDPGQRPAKICRPELPPTQTQT